jgi:hypothetical protein
MKLSENVLKQYPNAIYVETDTPCCEDDSIQLTDEKFIQILGSIYGFYPPKYGTELISSVGGTVSIIMNNEVYDTIEEAVNSFKN